VDQVLDRCLFFDYNDISDQGQYGTENRPLSQCPSAHLVVVTGVDVERGIVYMNNPQNARGIQTFEEFSTGYVDSFGNTIHGMNFGGIYVPKCSSLNR
jgi:hypothetical protein